MRKRKLSEEERYEYSTNEKDHTVYYNQENGVLIMTQVSDFAPYEIFISVTYNVSKDNRLCSYIDFYNPKYLGKNKLDQFTKDVLIQALNSDWEHMKSLDYYEGMLPDQLPDFSVLEVW